MNQITNIYRLQAQKLQEQLSSLENELKQLTENWGGPPPMIFSGTGEGQKRFSDRELEDQILQNRRTGLFGAKVEDEKQNQAFKDAQAELARRRGAQNQPTATAAASTANAAAPASPAKPSAPASTDSGVRGGGVAPGRKPTEIVGDIPQQPDWLKDASGPLKLPGSFAGDRTGQGQATPTPAQVGSQASSQAGSQSGSEATQGNNQASGGFSGKDMAAAAAAGGLVVKSVYDYLGRQRGAKGPTSPKPTAPQPEAKPAVPGEAKGPSAPKKGGVTPPQPISTTPEPTGIPDWMKVTDQASAESRFGVGRVEAPTEVNPQLQSGSYKGEIKGPNWGKAQANPVPRVGRQNVSSQAGVNRATKTPLSGTYNPMAVWNTALPDGWSLQTANPNAPDARWNTPKSAQAPKGEVSAPEAPKAASAQQAQTSTKGGKLKGVARGAGAVAAEIPAMMVGGEVTGQTAKLMGTGETDTEIANIAGSFAAPAALQAYGVGGLPGGGAAAVGYVGGRLIDKGMEASGVADVQRAASEKTLGNLLRWQSGQGEGIKDAGEATAKAEKMSQDAKAARATDITKGFASAAEAEEAAKKRRTPEGQKAYQDEMEKARVRELERQEKGSAYTARMMGTDTAETIIPDWVTDIGEYDPLGRATSATLGAVGEYVPGAKYVGNKAMDFMNWLNK
jgi:hypothetical protein